MNNEPLQAETDVLIIGAGAAGMLGAIEAARAGCRVLLIDRSLIGRGGATVMAQMTVAAALGSEVPDHWAHHFDDTRNMLLVARVVAQAGLNQSARMPENLTTVPHLSVCSAISLPKSAGEPDSGLMPNSSSRVAIF